MIWDDKFLKIVYHPFCPDGSKFAFFHSETNVPLPTQDLELSSRFLKTESFYNFSIRILILSCP